MRKRPKGVSSEVDIANRKIYNITILLVIFLSLGCLLETAIGIEKVCTVADGAELIEVYSDDVFFEGPTWDLASGRLYFVAYGEPKQLLRLDEPGKASVWMNNTEGINGTFLSIDGRLLTAEVIAHKVCSYRIGTNGPEDAKTLAHNKKWHQPNDLCQTPRGDIYFTDPNWKKPTTSAVYRLSPSGQVTKVATEVKAPNGIIASNDGRVLYVADSIEKLWRCYPINADGSVGQGKVFFNPETESRKDPDGMTIDEHGNLYLTGRGGVWVVSPVGEKLAFVKIPEFCSNVIFGGHDGKTLYITCDKKVYSLAMKIRGGK